MDWSTYFYTGIDGRRFACRLIILHTRMQTIYSFRSITGGVILNITKQAKSWKYHSGSRYYKDSWIAELGNQVDSGLDLPALKQIFS
ncbi:hypothetical protein [Pedobacter miscanthi]|uniref:Uncharacterized protein n=1 Tax=Pedobacter miscanthi TaxID=2259170 RepID=A0A366LDV2_9SPHI|nr:hypothetical protein [Pedobacter miscanthi]RBQ12055.1 hypothetical protein DRW42_02010 [Pedobacter miscanthi]